MINIKWETRKKWCNFWKGTKEMKHWKSSNFGNSLLTNWWGIKLSKNSKRRKEKPSQTQSLILKSCLIPPSQRMWPLDQMWSKSRKNWFISCNTHLMMRNASLLLIHSWRYWKRLLRKKKINRKKWKCKIFSIVSEPLKWFCSFFPIIQNTQIRRCWW
jgi:hypothetical protein